MTDLYIQNYLVKDNDEDKVEYKQYFKIIMLMIIPFILATIMVYNPKLKNKLLTNISLIKTKNKEISTIFIFIIISILIQIFLHWQLISTLIIGYIFGMKIGFPLALFVTMISTSISYYISKFITIENKIILKDKTPLMNVIISRLFLPQHMTSYYWGSTNIYFKTFFIGTLITMIPITLIEVYSGSLFNNISDLKDKILKSNIFNKISNFNKYILILLLIIIVIIYVIFRKYKKEIINSKREKEIINSKREKDIN